MRTSTERLVQIGAVCLILYFGWSLLSQTVVWMINMQVANNGLQNELKACRAAVEKSPSK